MGGINNTLQIENSVQSVPFSAPTDTDRVISSADVAPVDPAEAAQVHAALSHPYFSNHPSQTAASGIGDIVIGSSASTERRRLPRPAVLGLIGLAVVLVVSIVVIALTVLGSNNSVPSTHVGSYYNAVSVAQEDFYRFSNLVLYGDDNKVVPLAGEYDRWGGYELTNQFYKEPHDSNFWKKAEEYLERSVDTFTESTNEYSKSGAEVDDNLVNNLQQFLLNFQFLSKYYDVSPIDESQIYLTYYERGEAVARDYVEAYYSGYSNSSIVGMEFLSQKTAQYNALIDYIRLFADAGCLNQDGISGECANPPTDGEALLSASGAVHGYDLLSEETIQALVRNTEGNCWNISQQLTDLLGELNNG